MAGLVVCAIAASRPVCPGCSTETLHLTLTDGTRLAARLYAPATGSANLPAVVVVPGYLANIGFVEVPWARDLTALGLVALFLDRRGHGQSSGDWWRPAQNGDVRLPDLSPDIGAAVAYLRNRAPLVDPARIALLGHSDGGSAAIVAASADWQVAATVALSASVAPWEYVNHVAPRDLLLLYGSEDRFIVEDTDAWLIAAATRGYLRGEGQIGSLADGSARGFRRITGYGHLDVLYSAAARHAALKWLAGALAIDSAPQLSPLRWHWVVAGLVLLVLLVWTWDGIPPAAPTREPWPARSGRLMVLTALWIAGLCLASWIGPRLHSVPVQEGNIVASVLVGTGMCMSAVAIPLMMRRHRRRSRRRWLRDVSRGAIAGLAVQLAAEAILQPVYGFTLNAQRLALFGLFAIVSLPAFAATCTATTWVPQGCVVRGVPVEVALAGVTALLATVLFVRMSALPIVLLACTLVFVGAYRAAGRATVSAAAFGAVMYARAAADVCAFY